MKTDKTFQKALFCVTSLFSLLILLMLTAGVHGEDFQYTINNGTITITGYTGSGGAVIIPSTINGLPVANIGDYAFAGCSSLTNIVIPNSVTNIDVYAFKDCNRLKSVTIPDSVTHIGNFAFKSCTSLTSATIPSSVASIGASAFANCIRLTSITIPNSVTSIGDDAFLYCDSLKSITVDTQNSVFSSLSGILFNKNQTMLIQFPGGKPGAYTIPNSVISIGDFAFSGCTSLTSVTIPNSVISIGHHAFHYCTSLTSVVIPNSVISIGDNAFCYCTSLTSATIPNSVTSIGDCAFSNCTSLTSVTIPNRVTRIGYAAFDDCTSLTSVTIPDSVTSIGYAAFSGCTSLTSVTIPNSVTSIGDCAFSGCTSLTSVTIPNSVTNIGNFAFKSCASLTSATIPNSVTSIGDHAFEGCSSLTSVTIPNRVTRIGDATFAGCSSLTSVLIPNSVISIGHHAFYYCTSLTSVVIPNGVTSIGVCAFYYCSSLTSVTIPDSVASIGGDAFGYCSSLTSVTIPNSVTSIGGDAFGYCSSLTSVTIPNSVTSIGDTWTTYAFRFCDSLKSITVDTQNSVFSSLSGVLFNKNQTMLIQFPGGKPGPYTIPNSVTNIGEYAFAGCSSLTSVTIPNRVTRIGDGAFDGCTSLTSVTIPDSVTSIGRFAFCNCKNLSEVYFQGNPPSIGDWVFSYDNKLTVYYLAGTTGWGTTFGGRPAAIWNLAPIISKQPLNQTIAAGNSASFSITAFGSGPLNYQWRKNGVNIAGANSSTLTIQDARASDSEAYSVVVWNAYGSATSDAASLSVLADGANGIKPVKIVTQPIPETPTSAKKLVFITHGWQPIWTAHESPQWVTDMGNAIRAKVSSDWQVIPWFWTDGAWTAAPWQALHNAEIIGKNLAKDIESKSFQEIHLIAHSAGSAIIQAIADQLQESPNRPVIHLTFLDPYLGNFSEKQGVYGANARWSDSYYVQDGTGDFTSGYLNHALNVDVSWVDPSHKPVPFIGLGGGKVAVSSHGYPCDFYMQSIINTDPNWCPAEYGFALSQEVEGVFWLNNQANYPVDTGPWLPCSPSDAVKNPNPNITAIEAGIAGIPVDISAVAHAVGNAGSSLISGAGFVLNSIWSGIPHLNSGGLQTLDTVSSTNTPAWLAVGVTVTNRINFVQFDSGYTDTNAAEGLLTVYWNTNQIGMVDERVASAGLQQYRFALPETVTNGLYTLSFRLDSFGNTSTIAVTNVATGFVGVSQPITLSLYLTNGSPMLQLTGETNYTYLVQSSTNLVNWIPKALLLNTNGTVQFIDSEETNDTTKYYRAVMP
jgi:hypothetical protein